MKNKEYYTKKFEEYCEWEKAEYLNAGGEEHRFEHLYEYINEEEIVGYYIEMYGDDALKTWEENLQYVDELTESDIEVTRILEELYK